MSRVVIPLAICLLMFVFFLFFFVEDEVEKKIKLFLEAQQDALSCN